MNDRCINTHYQQNLSERVTQFLGICNLEENTRFLSLFNILTNTYRSSDKGEKTRSNINCNYSKNFRKQED